MLAFAPVTYFHEDQYFRQSWLWVLIAVPIIVVLVVLASAPRVDTVGIAVGVGAALLVALLLGLARLETEVRDDGVYVHFHGLWPTRRIALEDIDTYEARRYTMWDSGGWGVHFTLRGIAYNVSGNEGVVIQLKKGKGGQVLIGSQRPAELGAAIAKALAARRI